MEIENFHENPVLTYQESQELDAYSQLEWRFSGIHLMGVAAKSFLEAYRSLFETTDLTVILCGKGNNGGDGYALGFYLYSENKKVLILEWSDNPKTESTLFFRNCYLKLNGQTFTFHHWRDLEKDLPTKTLIVDCVLGTGAKSQLPQEVEELFQSIQSYQKMNSNLRILALDHKTGAGYLNYHSLGEIGCFKKENLSTPLSQKRSIPIGFPLDSFWNSQKKDSSKTYYFQIPKFLETKEALESLELPKNPFAKKENHHKYQSGSCIFLGGEEGMEGGLHLSQSAFLGLGGGISKTYFFSRQAKQVLLSSNPSLMIEEWKSTSWNHGFWEKSNTLVFGPGTNPNEDYSEILLGIGRWLKGKSTRKVVLDAGAIPNADQASKIDWNEQWYLTPHLGEFQKLIGAIVEDSTKDILEKSKSFTSERKCNLVIKTSKTIYTNHKSHSWIWDLPNPKLATMGTGDLFSGILGLALARGYSDRNAVFLSLSLFHQSKFMKLNSPNSSEILNYLKEL